MPYITKRKREKYDQLIMQLTYLIKDDKLDEMDGSLNYIISKILRSTYPLKYFSQNRAIGVLECVKQEHYRTQVGPYEDQKIKENGDV
jgi:hypothetical protein